MSDIHFNDPKFDPKKFNPLEAPVFKSGTQFEQHMKLVQAGLHKLGVKDHELPDFERLITRARVAIINARKHAESYADNCRAAGKDIDHKEVWRLLESHLLNGLYQFNQEEMLLVLVFFLTQIIKSEIV